MRLTTYTQTQKIDALKLWLITGNLAATAAALKIPYETLKTWKTTQWWNDTAVEIKSEGRLELSAKLRKVAEKAVGETLDRLENGDVRISPTGELQRVKVSAAVAAKIATDFIDKAESLERGPETSLTSVQDRLKSLAENFEKFSRKVRRIEVEDALPESSSSQMDVREQAQDGEGVGSQDTFDIPFTEKTEASQTQE